VWASAGLVRCKVRDSDNYGHDVWQPRFCRVTPVALSFFHNTESAAQADGQDPLWQIPLSRIASVQVELGGRFCVEVTITGGVTSPLQILSSGQATGARRWADAVYAAKTGILLAEATRLRECFRPCLRRLAANVAPHALRSLLKEARVAPALMPEDDRLAECIAVGPGGHVSWLNHRGEALLRAVLKAVGQTECVELWENESSQEEGPQQEATPPHWQQSDGGELATGPLDDGPCRTGWSWLSSWAVDSADRAIFGPEGWQHAASFQENQWRPGHGVHQGVRRRRWFRVQIKLGKERSPVLGPLRSSSAEELRGTKLTACIKACGSPLRLARSRSERRFAPYAPASGRVH